MNNNYLRMLIFDAMSSSLSVMAEYGDDEAALMQEIMNCDVDILNEYKSIWIDED